MLDLRDKSIEYYGLNICNGHILHDKIYYHWDGTFNSVPREIEYLLKPFDFCIRKAEYDSSISCFIPNMTKDKFNTLASYFNDNGIPLTNDFLETFWEMYSQTNDSHYDPIVSIKYRKEKIMGIAFYISALKDKTLMDEYLEQALGIIKEEDTPIIEQFIKRTVLSNAADIYLLSWDVSSNRPMQNKIYLKVKIKNAFFQLLSEFFPEVIRFCNVNQYRLSEIALNISNKRYNCFNLYFKPL